MAPALGLPDPVHPRRYSQLSELALSGDADGYPGKNEVADYLEAYALRHGFDVRTGEPVDSLADDSGGFRITTRRGEYHAAHVVVATGAFSEPAVPTFAGELGDTVAQLHSSRYRNARQIHDGKVIVVGGGNTGVQIAAELSATHPVWLSVSSLNRAVPQRVLGRDLFWWLERFDMVRAGRDTRRGRMMSQGETFIGTDLRALFHRVWRLPRATGAAAGAVLFEDGRVCRPRTVIWATGFRPSYPWLHLPVLDGRGRPRLRDDTTALPGLHFVGPPWQRSRGSALLGWVSEDAALVADRIANTPAPELQVAA